MHMKMVKRWLLCIILMLGLMMNSIAVLASGETQPVTEESSDTSEENADGESDEGTDSTNATDLGLTSESALLMEADSGTVLYEQNSTKQLRPASITKIMTLILIFDALEDGKIHLEDNVTTSAYAKSMGGSQVFLEEGEVQTVETLIKCIVVASGNDASVAMAEYIAGSETEFVRQMNERAQGLGMEQTHFEDCCGLTDSETHLTSAKDVAIMSRELVTKYPQIHNYSSIWMEDITHTTRQGTSTFTLANTNKLLRQFEGCNGLKTGSTSLAKYCLSATAERDGIKLIAVIMAAPESKVRFAEASSLLNYGFSNCKRYVDEEMPALSDIQVSRSVVKSIPLKYDGEFSYVSTANEDFASIEKEIEMEEKIEAPVKKNTKVGQINYKLNGKTLGSVDIVTDGEALKATFIDYFKQLWQQI